MKSGLRLGKRGTPLVVGFGLAITVHVLGFSLVPGRRPVQGGPAPLENRDNTPELLQWSSQTAPLPNLEVLPLPKSAVLPPPPAAYLPRKGASGRRGPVKGARGQGPGGAWLTSTARSGESQQGRPGATRQAGKPRIAGPLDGGGQGGDWAMALNQLQAVVERNPPGADAAQDAVAAPSTAAMEDSGPPRRLALESPGREAYQSLWRQARPQRLPPLPTQAPGTRGAPEMRQVSLGQVRAAAVPIRHGELVVLPGEVLLIWLQGEKIFLLRSATPPQPGR
ncbi:MAG: hypothetical protein ACK59A_06820 [Cyanobacteriota bacterium]